jgi:hemoglobin
LVDTFYARVRADGALGPIFNDAIPDWPEHLDKLAAFWWSCSPAAATKGSRCRPI